jgi:hypothetical protein
MNYSSVELARLWITSLKVCQEVVEPVQGNFRFSRKWLKTKRLNPQASLPPGQQFKPGTSRNTTKNTVRPAYVKPGDYVNYKSRFNFHPCSWEVSSPSATSHIVSSASCHYSVTLLSKLTRQSGLDGKWYINPLKPSGNYMYHLF